MSALILTVRFENARRDGIYGAIHETASDLSNETVVENDLTDGENTRFRYII